MRAAWLLVVLLPSLAMAGGSWVATAPSVRVVLADRESVSAPLVPSGARPLGAIERVAWRFRLPPGRSVRGRLCHPGGCLALDAPRGSSRALAGLPADAALRFRFALASGPREAVEVGALQVIVNYR